MTTNMSELTMIPVLLKGESNVGNTADGEGQQH